MDLDDFLQDMPFERGRLGVRVAVARDGRRVLLVRVELGILQLELEGRPDGGESVLERLLAERASFETAHADRDGGAALRLELVQYQQRAMALTAAGLVDLAIADWDRAALGAELLRRSGGDEAEWAAGFGFSVLVERTRTLARRALAEGRGREAAAAIGAGLEALAARAAEIGLGTAFEGLADIVALRAWRDSLVPRLPPAQRAELEARLRAAIAAENYELAAILRDELRLL
ncbi:MAG: hypothetical protein RI967_2667 [Planctomycetota bacterium]|jgi:hypothetical protein